MIAPSPKQASFVALALLALQETIATSLDPRDDSYFTDFEDIAHSVVEYIPFVGTLYSSARVGIAWEERDAKHYWSSLADCAESAIRDIAVVAKWAEPVTVALVHSMAESFTEKVIELYHSSPAIGRVQLTGPPLEAAKNSSYLLVAEGRPGRNAPKFFGGRAKGVHYFYGASFTGILKEEKYASAGEKICLDTPRGLYDGAPILLSWRWTKDDTGVAHRPEAVRGQVHLHPGTGKPRRFEVVNRKGAGSWHGYNFWGTIKSRDRITIFLTIDGTDVKVDMRRVKGT
ncbi:amylase cluster transcriptional regulator [Purpureocillium lavendulum]|uniref:Amylase cluster transcriptional regulator n=1 Tax=Purpureocillium lavendulum TaxID=1247861 RepID=A0AB34FMB0_9HYPO|nr:amylase cluster transcriptional regulator [Purpureocillium lavendulum]